MPHGGESYVGAVEWARTVGSEDEHGLRDLEDVVLWKHPDNGARLKWDEDRGLGLYGVFVVAYGFAACAPVVGPAVFSGATYRGILGDGEVDVDSAFPLTAVAFIVGVVFLVGMLVQWWRERSRSTAVLVFAVLAVVCGLVTLLLANDYTDEFRGNATRLLIPVWIVIAVGVVVALAHVASPAESRRARLATKGLADESRALLLGERDAALRVLSDRGMVTGHDLASLSARALGELHVATEDARGE